MEQGNEAELANFRDQNLLKAFTEIQIYLPEDRHKNLKELFNYCEGLYNYAELAKKQIQELCGHLNTLQQGQFINNNAMVQLANLEEQSKSYEDHMEKMAQQATAAMKQAAVFTTFFDGEIIGRWDEESEEYQKERRATFKTLDNYRLRGNHNGIDKKVRAQQIAEFNLKEESKRLVKQITLITMKGDIISDWIAQDKETAGQEAERKMLKELEKLREKKRKRDEDEKREEEEIYLLQKKLEEKRQRTGEAVTMTI
jgi:hypothetical protein